MFEAIARQRWWHTVIVITIVIFRKLSHCFWSPFAVWFSRRETELDNTILGLSHDLQDGGRIME